MIAREPDHGARASSPSAFTRAVWVDLLKRSWKKSRAHRLDMMAASIAFYAFLSFVPLLGAIVMSYGLVADPSDLVKHMRLMLAILPADVATIVNEQLATLVLSAADKKGLGLALALGLAVLSATRASSAVIAALTVIYEEQDRRGLFRGMLISAALILVAIVVGLTGVTAAALVAFARALSGVTGPFAAIVVRLIAWAIAGALCCLSLGAMYRFAPQRSNARWEWLSVGAIAATLLWLGATLLFGLYAANFGNFDVAYGSLGAVAVLMIWLYISAYSVLIGALINAEAERQTARDSTTGPELPMGERGATMADTSAALARSDHIDPALSASSPGRGSGPRS